MHDSYGRFVKPRLAGVLEAVGLDLHYTRAEGDWLYHRDADGRERRVLDVLGGYGALLLGHNHPAIVAAARGMLERQVPVHAQFSLRGRSGELARRLDHIARRETGDDTGFITTFANSGAEAVELAIKHAELERMLKLEALLDRITVNIEAVRDALRRGEARLDPDLYEFTDMREQVFDVRSFDDLIVALINHNSVQLGKRPVFLALEKSFHGKLAGTVQLTYNKSFRRAFQYFGLKVRFVGMDDAGALERIARDEYLELFDLCIEDGRVRLVRQPLPIFTAFLLEPIQGEGGIRPVAQDFGRAVRRFCNQQDCPLILDEIQSGMGRCGRFFASSHINLRGDYYTLSKSLGGGLAKIAATLIRRDRYQDVFGLIHSSTFAEDDFSSGIALAVLDLLEANEGALYRQAAERGARLREMLDGLWQRYPDVIREVRGQGLFLGLEFHGLGSAASQILRSTAHSDSLGYFLAGYLLRVEGIRLAPTGSAPDVLRLEPSLYIQDESIEQLRAALERVCLILQRQDVLHLVFPLTDADRPTPRDDIRDCRPAVAQPFRDDAPLHPVRKVAFINHLISPGWLRQVDPSLAGLTDGELRRFVQKMSANRKSAPYPPVRIVSALGRAVDFILYPLCVDSEQMGGWLQTGQLKDIRKDIDERIRTARADGCEIAGLGMYTSIVTNNGTALSIPEIGLTTGNALTIAMSLEAIQCSMAQQGLAWKDALPAVIGAAGNIASTYAAMLAEHAPGLLLIGSGRDGAHARVLQTVYNIYDAAWQALQSGQYGQHGIYARLAEEPFIGQWLREGAPAKACGKRIHQALLDRYGQDPFLAVHSDLQAARDSRIVLCAANAPEPFIGSEHLARGALVCDVAVPHNVLPSAVRERPDITYLQGGIVATPDGASLHPGARAFLGEGQLFACMAETAVLGLAGLCDHYSHGPVSPRQVREIAALARLHGFRLADLKRGNSL